MNFYSRKLRAAGRFWGYSKVFVLPRGKFFINFGQDEAFPCWQAKDYINYCI